MTQLDYHMDDFGAVHGAEPDDFSYGVDLDDKVQPAQIAIFSDRRALRREMIEDLSGAGFRAQSGGTMADLLCALENAGGDLGVPAVLNAQVVIVDCLQVEARDLAALARLDSYAADGTMNLVVSTSLEALEDVFAALDRSDPQILVQPSRADRILAVGRVMADIADPRVREMSEEDRLNLLNLSRQVEAIAHKLEGLSGGQTSLRAHSQTTLADDGVNARAQTAPSLPNSWQPELPDPKHVRRIISARQARAKFFDEELFADPAWDMLLDLTAAHAEKAQVSVTSLCIAAAVPATTALRWIKQLVDIGVFIRIADTNDRRRAFVGLSDQSLNAMARYFAEIDPPLERVA